MKFAIALAVATLVASTAAVCFQDNSSGTLLPLFLGANGLPQCAAGFMCPGLNASDPSTYPVFCPPSPNCAGRRLFAQTCPPQGTYEPILCPAGSYCPAGATMVSCPQGYYCPPGSNEPKPCPPLTICPAGSKFGIYLGGVIALAATSVVFVAVVCIYRRWRNRPATTTGEYRGINVDDVQGDDVAQGALRDLCDGFARRRGGTDPMNIFFKDLRVVIDVPTSASPVSLFSPDPDRPATNPFSLALSAETKEKVLLANVSGSIPSGKVVAIMGPSGCGKTTLLNALIGRLASSTRLTGTVGIETRAGGAVSGELLGLASKVGFVPQDDVLHQELSVCSNIYYASELRLPRGWTREEKDAFRDSVVLSMGLDEVRHVAIGDEETRGISGGQRKRASISVELAGAPLALFLDEPTSGLDSTTALSVCESMKRIAVRAQIPVAMVIHQPRREIWMSLDTLLLLAPGGRTVYEGPRAELEPYLMQLNTFGNPSGRTVFESPQAELESYLTANPSGVRFAGFPPDLNPVASPEHARFRVLDLLLLVDAFLLRHVRHRCDLRRCRAARNGCACSHGSLCRHCVHERVHSVPASAVQDLFCLLDEPGGAGAGDGARGVRVPEYACRMGLGKRACWRSDGHHLLHCACLLWHCICHSCHSPAVLRTMTKRRKKEGGKICSSARPPTHDEPRALSPGHCQLFSSLSPSCFVDCFCLISDPERVVAAKPRFPCLRCKRTRPASHLIFAGFNKRKEMQRRETGLFSFFFLFFSLRALPKRKLLLPPFI